MSQIYAPHALEKGLKVKFLEYFSSQESIAPQIAYVEKSDSDSEGYDWLGASPAMSELIGERQITPLANRKYTLVNRTFTSTISVSRNDLADNKSGSINRRISQLSAAAANHPNKLIIDALVAGTTDACYDGVALFHDAHPALGDEGGTQDNLLAGAGTSAANVAADFASTKAALLKFKDTSGEPFSNTGGMSLAIVCPPDLEKVFREVLNATIISNTSNVQVGAASLIVSPRLTDANDWYMLRTDSARALILQEREAVEFSALETGSDTSFLRDQYYFGCRSRMAAGAGFWQAACKVVNS